MTPVEHARIAFKFGQTNDFFLWQLQRLLMEWQSRNFVSRLTNQSTPAWQLALGVAEEVGELAHAILKHEQGIRGMQDEEAFLEAAGDAVADCTIFCIQLCTSLGLDFSTLLHLTAEEVMKRTAESVKVP